MDAISQIVDLELQSVVKRLEAIGYKLLVSDKAKNFVASKGYDMQYGARPLKRSVQTYVEDGIAELLVNGNLSENATIQVDVDEVNEGKLTFSVVENKL